LLADEPACSSIAAVSGSASARGGMEVARQTATTVKTVV